MCPKSETLAAETVTASGIGTGAACMADCKANLQNEIDFKIKSAAITCANSVVVDPVTNKVRGINPCTPSYSYTDAWNNPSQSDASIPTENSFVCTCSKTIQITRACAEVPDAATPGTPDPALLGLTCKPKGSSKEFPFLGGTMSMTGATYEEIVAKPGDLHTQNYCWTTPIVPPVFNLLLGDRLPAGWEVGGGHIRDVRYNDRGGILPIAEQAWFGLCIKTPIGNCWFGMVEVNH
jgi:hypothetical protein